MRWILEAMMAFVGTNADDIVILTLLFAQSGSGKERKSIWAGQLAGIFILTLAGIAGAGVARLFPGNAIRLLGLIPLGMGLRAWLGRKEEEGGVLQGLRWWQVMLLTLANGGDNIGVYIPVFSGFTGWQQAGAVALFGAMTCLWCWMGMQAGGMAAVRRYIEKYRHVAVPVLLMALGIMILLG